MDHDSNKGGSRKHFQKNQSIMAGENSKVLVLFDFDGTIISKDTLFLFLQYYKGRYVFIKNMIGLLPVLLLFKLKLLSNWRTKEFVLKKFLQNEPLADFKIKCETFAYNILPKYIKASARAKIESYLKEGAHIVVVSASPECWVLPWCKTMKIDCIASRLEIKNGKITGHLSGKNCHGEEKVERIKSVINLNNYSKIEAYGDSKGDLPMMQLANIQYYKQFK